MPISTKRLRSVTHSIGHHGISALSHLHPHVGHLCRAAEMNSAVLDFKNVLVMTPDHVESAPLLNALTGLRNTFQRILSAEGGSLDEICSARIEFFFTDYDWPASCKVFVVSSQGAEIEYWLDDQGNPIVV